MRPSLPSFWKKKETSQPQIDSSLSTPSPLQSESEQCLPSSEDGLGDGQSPPVEINVEKDEAAQLLNDTASSNDAFQERNMGTLERVVAGRSVSNVRDEENGAESFFPAPTPGPTGFAFNSPKNPDSGEDADPVLSWRENQAFLAVCDGMGGSGSTTYQRNDQSYTGAYIASRVVADEMRRLFTPSFPFPNLPLSQAQISRMEEQLHTLLNREAADLERGSEPSRLKSTLIRRLPTTLAALLLEINGEGVQAQTIWAGDSRAYLLDPDDGLQQLTVDDLKADFDALQNLTDDSPLSNFVSADGGFELRSQTYSLSLPAVFLAASDGCFGYLFSPAHFEDLLLDSLSQAANVHAWKNEIVGRLRQVAGDDCSMALLALGFASFSQLQAAFTQRQSDLQEKFIVPLDELTKQVNADSELIRQAEGRKSAAEKQRQSLREELWRQYKPAHEKRIAARTSGVGRITDEKE